MCLSSTSGCVLMRGCFILGVSVLVGGGLLVGVVVRGVMGLIVLSCLGFAGRCLWDCVGD